MMRRLIFRLVSGFALAVAAGGFFTLQAATTAAQWFRLQIDGRTRAEEIEIGARNTHPDEDPLVAILR